MPTDRSSLQALRDLIEQASLLLETTPDLPQNRMAACREDLAAALALADDLLSQAKAKTPPAAILGHKGGSSTSQKHGPEHYRKMAAARKTHGGGRPRKRSE